MAAKVALVAVPTVLGIASIRVYTVSEAPTDGVRREKLNIYTPLPPPAQVKFLPESPGAIENGLTTVREGVLPAYQAVKGAGVSVKTGTINLYHAGQDVFYYLKDPPPDFLPRFGTITMAGLLGMFLTRKGSHLKKFAVPLGLMSAGASVCYPAQAVAVCKVTGKKLYAAGQWSSAAVSSLFTSKEPAAKDLLASQPQVKTKAQSATIPETEVESAESAPVSDEPVSAVITEEESSAALAEISPDPVPTETGSGITAIDPCLFVFLSASLSFTLQQTETDADSESVFSLLRSFRGSNASFSSLMTDMLHFPRCPAEGSSFKPDPSLVDFGQSSPEDADLYTTRS
uniref:MICOS complex subunit n=1 Tax=Salarias fasciatus TaxID=181472 RepID=A0A672JB79_SALFA